MKRTKPIMARSNVIIAAILIAIVGVYYYYVSNVGKSEEEPAVTAVQNVLLRNLENDYPPTPRELIKYYSDIVKCLYNEKYSDEQLEQLADKALELYDEELAANNPRDQYITSLRSDVQSFTEQNYTIVEYSLPSSVDIEEYIQDDRQCASLYCTYSVKTGGVNFVASKQVFVLRREKGTGHWKIFGFDIVNS